MPRLSRAEYRHPGESQAGKRSNKRPSRKEAIAKGVGLEDTRERTQNRVIYAGSSGKGHGSTVMATPIRMRRARLGCFPAQGAQGGETLDSWYSLENSCRDRKRKTVPPKDESNKKRHRDVRNQLKVLSLFQPIPRPPRCLHFSLVGSGLLHPASCPLMKANRMHSLCQNGSRIAVLDRFDPGETGVMEVTATQGTIQRHLIVRNYFYESFSCLAPSLERLTIVRTPALFLSNRWSFF
jgi:hypothetical protein